MVAESRLVKGVIRMVSVPLDVVQKFTGVRERRVAAICKQHHQFLMNVFLTRQPNAKTSDKLKSGVELSVIGPPHGRAKLGLIAAWIIGQLDRERKKRGRVHVRGAIEMQNVEKTRVPN
jgi:hypothetical protein